MEVAITHYEALKSFLATHLAKEQANSSRTNAREKLTKLTKQQFQELSTDVYDELTRRLLDSNEVPFLPLREDFHPKRNQARQKLATLPKNRFKDLASDVYYELERRYSELKDIEFSTPTNDNSSQKKSIDVSTPGQAPKSNTIVPEISTLRQETISVNFHIQKPNTRPENTVTNGENSSTGNNNSSNFPSLSDYGSPISPRSRTQSSTSSVSDFGRRYNGMSMSSVSSSDSRNRDTANSQKGGKPDVVNFASLDSLMADLGDMIDKKQNGNVPNPSAGRNAEGNFDMDKIRSDYELKIATLQKRIKELESKLSTRNSSVANNSRIQDLERQVEEQASRLIEMEQKLDESNQQQQEVETILESFQTISAKYDELCSEKEQDAAKIKDLTTESNEWKSKYEKTKIELRNLKATSSFFKEAPKVDVVKDNSLAPTPDGAINESKIVSYQAAIDDLLRAGRSDVPADVLIAMKSIVIACKSITEDVDVHEQLKASSMKAEDRDKLHALKNKLSATLTNLMTAAKNHATGYGISPVSLLDAAASHLTASVVDLVKLVKLRRTGGRDTNRIDQEPPLPIKSSSDTLPVSSPQINDPESTIVENTNGRDGVNIDELKDFLERQTEAIVQAIQTLLAAIRNQSYGKELTDNINMITTIVLNVIAVCRDSFGSSSGAPYRTHGETILKELENSVEKLEEMRETITNNSEDFLSNKASKQRLASASFEIAKFTKELVGLVE